MNIVVLLLEGGVMRRSPTLFLKSEIGLLISRTRRMQQYSIFTCTLHIVDSTNKIYTCTCLYFVAFAAGPNILSKRALCSPGHLNTIIG